MKFSEVVAQASALLQRKGRITYRALQREFDLDDEALADLKDELIDAEQVAHDENGKVLVWVGAASVQPSTFQVSRSPQSLIPNPQSPAERRQLTVLFCDLVGSTTLSELLDPEDLREVVQAYHAMCAGVVTRYVGYTAQHLGDGLLVYFGYPSAHEDEAARAVRTSLEILAGLQLLNARMRPALKARLPHPIQVRIGIHTGLVVIGEIGSSEKKEVLALGETPNLAARLQGIAEPDTVVISAATQRLVSGLFEYQDLGTQLLKGLSTPVAVYQVLGESVAQSRFEATVNAGLTPLVGREGELSLLQQRWNQAKQGAGQVVLLNGEPGIGKSRLIQELKEQLRREEVTCIEFHCSPYHQNSALYPIIDHLQRLLQFTREDTPAAKLEKLQRTLALYRFPQADTVPLLATLLSLPHPEGYPLITVSPQKQKEKTQAVLVGWLIEEAEQRPVCTVWEDLHWADPSTLEVLTLLLDQGPTTRLLTLLTCRPEFISPWGSRSYLTQLTLDRLGWPQVEVMVERVTGEKALPSEVVQQIVSKTDGVPLFVEELTKTVVENIGQRATGNGQRGGQSGAVLGIPSSLQDALMARLDRLGSAKEIAQLGATLGREFSYELLHAVANQNESILQQGLQQLVAAELVYQRGLGPQAHYLFKHALIQDTAYQSLLKSRRQQLHERIAQVLEERFVEIKEAQPELLARHYTEAGHAEQAIPYWQRAGERASQRSAYVEAISHLTKGIEVLKTLPNVPEHAPQELTLQLALNDALVTVKGYTAPEVRKTVLRARELCQQLGETPQLFPMLFRLWVFYIMRRELPTAREMSEQLMRLARSIKDLFLLVLAHAALGITSYWLGELTSARSHLDQAITWYDPQKHPRSSVGTADPRVDFLTYAAWTLWRLGYPDQALKRSQEAMALATVLSHPFSLSYALMGIALLHLALREGKLAREEAEEVMSLSTEQGFPFWLPQATIVRGWALADQGQVEEGITQIQQGLAAYRNMGAETERKGFLPLLIATYAQGTQAEAGLSVLPESLDFVDKTGVRYYESDLYRLKGELTLQLQVESHKTQIKEAEACFLKAIEIAQKQQAKSPELRATMSLARLWQQQGKKTEARQILADVYNWFTEGFDTGDLREAKALLEELSD